LIGQWLILSNTGAGGGTITSTTVVTVPITVSGYTFSTPYTNYKFIFYLTCLGYYGVT
jgi:hypothetical protein